MGVTDNWDFKVRDSSQIPQLELSLITILLIIGFDDYYVKRQ